MSKEQWTAVDQYIGESLLKGDPTYDFALKNSDASGLPAIQVSAAQGKTRDDVAEMFCRQVATLTKRAAAHLPSG